MFTEYSDVQISELKKLDIDAQMRIKKIKKRIQREKILAAILFTAAGAVHLAVAYVIIHFIIKFW